MSTFFDVLRIDDFLAPRFVSDPEVADWPSRPSLASDFDDAITFVDAVVAPFDVDEVIIPLTVDDVISFVETSVVFAVETESKLFSASASLI